MKHQERLFGSGSALPPEPVLSVGGGESDYSAAALGLEDCNFPGDGRARAPRDLDQSAGGDSNLGELRSTFAR